MCEDSAVVIRDVTNMALIGSETTTTKSVQMDDGEVVDVTEPSTVIDCHGCPTGFVFTNVSELSVKGITLIRCGGEFTESDVTKVSLTSYLSALTIVNVHNLTLDTVSFTNTTRNYGLIAINVLGKLTIRNTVVQEEVSEYQHGNILLSYTELHSQVLQMKEAHYVLIQWFFSTLKVEKVLLPYRMAGHT